MPAYVDLNVEEFLSTSDSALLSKLHSAYASDGFLSQYTTQTVAWEASLPLIKEGLNLVVRHYDAALNWRILLELPLYRLRRRIDLIVVTPKALVVVELKVGETAFLSADLRQVEEYALDLRDFHEHCLEVPIVPALWSTEANYDTRELPLLQPGVAQTVVKIGNSQFGPFLRDLGRIIEPLPSTVHHDWVSGTYKPVPSVIEAATSLFSGHGVEEIAQADATNLDVAAEALVALIDKARHERRRLLVFLTGVPGSGKTLAGLQAVHRTVTATGSKEGYVVYLSGNTPLVTVLREALIEDDYRRRKQNGESIKKNAVRSSVRARIQHIMDFLKEYVADPEERPPYERAIIFDEAQRAWDAAYGRQKFGRSASEPSLLLEIMGRHSDWCVIIGLIGGGQEINSGENGMAEWGDALRNLPTDRQSEWSIFGPPNMANGDVSTAYLGLGDLQDMKVYEEKNLTLTVPLRSYRSPLVSDWVAALLDGRIEDASSLMGQIGEFPIKLTRSSEVAKEWLIRQARGERRYGMVASSSASRLRAEGFGVSLSATDGRDIAYWYLAPRDDVRSSFALEVLANEYTTQGLELDFIGLCWGGDLIIENNCWGTRRFSGTSWVAARGERRRFILNSYRVLLTRAREGLIIWVPKGDPNDPTRNPATYDSIAGFLTQCGVKPVKE